MTQVINQGALRAISVFCLLCCALFSQQAAASVPVGKGEHVFAGWAGPPLKIHTYRPKSTTAETPIMIVMHGMRRDADRYRDEWAAVAEKIGLVVAAPEFDSTRFAKSAGYNLGGLGNASSRVSAFDAIEPMFDDLVARTGTTAEKYYLYGHSAGAQFVHRFVFAKPDARIETAFAANAGWYTMLNRNGAFPYGLKNSGLPRSTAKQALAKPLVVLLGDADIERADNLRKTPEADAQGRNRLLRGLVFFGTSASLARSKNLPFNWHLSIVPEAGHENAEMAWGAASFLRSSNPDKKAD